MSNQFVVCSQILAISVQYKKRQGQMTHIKKQTNQLKQLYNSGVIPLAHLMGSYPTSTAILS